MDSYKHFAHQHRLTHQISSKITCLVCRLQLRDDFYCCEPCNFYICRSCYKLPREIRHPFHKEHPLTLVAESPYDLVCDTYCNVCSNKIDGFRFHCSECNFDLDLNCATLMPITTKEEIIIHRHRWISCDRKNKDVEFSCSVCQLPIKGIIYVYLADRFGAILHKSCAQLPQQITHQFHPQHSLTLQHFPTLHPCKACRDFKGNFLYNCYECEFSLDVRCASLVPKAGIEENQLLLVEPFSSKFTHPHPLIPCDCSDTNFSFLCSACEISIEDEDEDGTVTVYVCLKCGLLLHKSCAELPPQIRHPFHPPHNLVLEEGRSSYSCNACKCSVRGFKYWCHSCYFAIDVTCASQNYSTFKDPLHQHHPLAIFNLNKHDSKHTINDECSICRRRPPIIPFLRCVLCDFTLDLGCFHQLPREFKHSCHDRHSLTLTRSPVKDNSDDDDDSEYYCDLCEKTRELRDPTYYCAECHYVAHLTCVFDEILPLLERERDEEIVMLQAEVDELSPNLETLKIKLDELKEKREQRVSEYQVASRLDDKNDAWVMETDIENESTFTKEVLCAIRDDPTIADLDAETHALTTKLNQLEKRREQRIGEIKVEIKNASTEKKTKRARDDAIFFLSSKDPTFLDAEEEITRVQADIDALTVKLKTKTTKLDGLKDRELHFECVEEKEEEEEDDDEEEEEDESDGTFTTRAA